MCIRDSAHTHTHKQLAEAMDYMSNTHTSRAIVNTDSFMVPKMNGRKKKSTGRMRKKKKRQSPLKRTLIKTIDLFFQLQDLKESS